MILSMRLIKYEKNKIRLTESVLRKIVRESVERMLKESKGKQKLQNSFKSKEDMTQYRDMYAPGSETTYVDDYGSTYDDDYDYGYGDWGSGPYKCSHYHEFDDDYDYCGDDDYNAEVSRYNDALYKRLATKGGQMSYDWDDMKHEYEEDIENQKRNLNNLKKVYDQIYQGKGKYNDIDYWKNIWLKGKPEDDDKFWNKISVEPRKSAEHAISRPWDFRFDEQDI